MRSLVVAPVLAALILPSCGGEEARASAHTLSLAETPPGLPPMEIPEDFTEARAALGKILFFDTRLSSDGTISCQTCHQHDEGWSNGKRFSTKVDGSENTRNSPTLYNVGYHDLLYWDGRKDTLEGNIEAAWKGHMGGDPDAMAETLNGIEAYRTRFEEAFSGEASGERIVEALADFVRTLRSGGSKVDRAAEGEVELTEAEQRGQELFTQQGCAICHVPPHYTDMIFHNVGIGMDAENPDPGRGAIDESLMGAFKTPTLRSAVRSGPYFHDGSAATLEEAVRIMVKGGVENPNRDPQLVPRDLTDEQIADLVAFIEALDSDETFVAPQVPE